MATKKNALETASKFVKELIKSGTKVRYAFLFGSYAHNKQRRFSDIDIAIVSDQFTGLGLKNIERILPVLSQDNFILIEPHTFSTLYFEEGDPLIDEIKKTGIAIKV